MHEVRLRSPVVSAYADAAWSNKSDQRSRYGFVLLLAGCRVSWATRSTTMVCLSTAEAEYIAATEAAKDVVWLRGLLNELGLLPPGPSNIMEDNQACIKMANNASVSGRNRHFCTKMAWLRTQVTCKAVYFSFVPSKNNTADTFTKILPPQEFLRLRSSLVQAEPVSVPSSV